ncbi:hypothetical protein N7462_005546 [Penicillium macrosclerotiorum]|uniref:uncharacterized protein n=1 Tax=Penicillium macrosclerotiorum TaxID=303699 RepID=UPI0025487DCE|nr:uncharacterized protein N7462_005546 [Penicillium macrosclerotiorum]KAJ5682381.1 hypothetical protein N7462_005546 [Penicillium macrosclerotiorum]
MTVSEPDHRIGAVRDRHSRSCTAPMYDKIRQLAVIERDNALSAHNWSFQFGPYRSDNAEAVALIFNQNEIGSCRLMCSLD